MSHLQSYMKPSRQGSTFFCFIADSLTFRCGFCHRHVVFAQAEQQKTKNRGIFAAHQKTTVKEIYTMARPWTCVFFCENVLLSFHFRQTSRARFIALKVALLQYPKIFAPNSTTVTSFHTYNPSCSSSSSRHASPCSVQQRPQHQKEPDNLVVQALKRPWCSSTYWHWPACNMQVVKITLCFFFWVGGRGFFFQNMHRPQCTPANRHQNPVATP